MKKLGKMYEFEATNKDTKEVFAGLFGSTVAIAVYVSENFGWRRFTIKRDGMLVARYDLTERKEGERNDVDGDSEKV